MTAELGEGAGLVQEPVWLDSVVSDPAKLQREARQRRSKYKTVSVAKALVPEKEDDGWVVERELKFRTRLRKPVAHDEQLENRLWHLFFKLGYPELSSGRNFQISIVRRGEDPVKKQIDVLAKDDETVIVAECKSSAELIRRSLQKDLEEFANLKGPIARAIKKHYGSDFKPKIIWMFVTNNIVWSLPDKTRARGEHIQIVTEAELRYYEQIAEHLGSAARFQFLAEFLEGQKIPELEGIKVPAVRGRLGGKTFYSFVSTPAQMLKISFINHRSLKDPSGAPSYQRLVGRTRLKQIARYIENKGFFPTNILVNFTSKCRFEQLAKDDGTNVVFGHLYLPNEYRSAWIIDGQHRLYGYAKADQKYMSQNLMVLAFEKLSGEAEANLFVDINHQQKSVPKTLLDDLEGDLKWGSTRPAERIGAISARMISRVNSDVGEPLYGRVTQQGIPGNDRICLTVPALKDGLRHSCLIGTAVRSKKEYKPGPLTGDSDEETLDRASEVVNAYFRLIMGANTSLWDAGRQGYLCTNTSLEGYLRLLDSIISHLETESGLDARQLTPKELVTEAKPFLEPILVWLESASPADMAAAYKVQYGSGGPTQYYYRLCQMVHDVTPDFDPPGLSDWAMTQSAVLVEDADRKLKELNVDVQRVIFDTFKQHYGTADDAYFYKGVIDNEIKTKAFKKSLEDDLSEKLPLENYLEFIEYKKIVENKVHWLWFKPLFDIPEPGVKGHAKNLKWMERINKLRRISAHPTEKRNYDPADFAYIDRIHSEFRSRLEAHANAGQPDSE